MKSITKRCMVINNMFAKLRKLQDSKELGDYISLLLIQGANYLIPIVLMPYLMKVLGASSFGLLGFSQAVIGYFLLFIDFGFNLSATKRIATNLKNRDAINTIFTATVFAKVFLLLSSLFILFICLELGLFPEYELGLYCSIPTIIGTTFTFTWLFQGYGKIRLISLISVLSRVLILPIIFFIVKDPKDYLIAIFIQSIVFCLTAFVSIIFIIKYDLISIVKVSWTQVKEELREGFPLFLSSASITMYTKMFILILGFTATPAVVGKYSAAERIMRALMLFFFTPLMQIYYPKISQISSKSKEKALILLYKVLLIGVVLMFFVFCFLFFGADYLYIFLGDGYVGISTLLRIFSFVPFFILIGGVFGQLGLLAIGDNNCKNKYKRAYYYTAFISVILVFFFTRYWIEKGTALTVVIAEFIVAFLMSYYFYKYIKIKSK